MADLELPSFRYHPDPVATGSIERAPARCAFCESPRGWRYTGPVFSTDNRPEICPWCIADGSAARSGAQFTDVSDDQLADVPAVVIDVVLGQTPGFSSWQDPRWMFHCRDGAAFLGLVGWPELQGHLGAIDMLLHEHDEYGWSEEDSREFVEGLGIDHDATAYLFRCLHCGTELAYADMS